MAAQATENTAHPTPPHSETEHSDQKSDQKSERRPSKPKTETEEKIEKATPPLNLNAPASEAGGTQRDSNKHVARRPQRTAVAQNGEQNGPRGAHPPQTGQQVATQNQQVQNKGKGAPSVRLDMNLDVDIALKAKIKGDIELSILGGQRGGR